VWFVKGSCSGNFDHAETVVGYYSNHSLSTDETHPDDIIAFLSSADLKRYYRRVDSWVDDVMSGALNCTNGSSGGSECHDQDTQSAFSMLGLADPEGVTVATSLTVPDAGKEAPPPFVEQITATVTVNGPLAVGASYTIYRFDGADAFPRDSNFADAESTSRHVFRAKSKGPYTWVDRKPFASNSAVYYATVKTRSAEDDD